MILILLKMKIKARSARPGVCPLIRPVSWTKAHNPSSFLDKLLHFVHFSGQDAALLHFSGALVG
jgi:hypothetical protein